MEICGVNNDVQSLSKSLANQINMGSKMGKALLGVDQEKKGEINLSSLYSREFKAKLLNLGYMIDCKQDCLFKVLLDTPSTLTKYY